MPAEEPFARGLEEFAAGRFFEAHESWEELWMRAEGEEKLFLQALIQLAAACVHLGRGNAAPAARLARLALEKLERLGETRRGLDLAALAGAIREALPRLDRGEKPRDIAAAFPLR